MGSRPDTFYDSRGHLGRDGRFGALLLFWFALRCWAGILEIVRYVGSIAGRLDNGLRVFFGDSSWPAISLS